jgi:hypothetical protein
MQTNGMTDIYDEANSRFSQLCERAEQQVTERAGKIMYEQQHNFYCAPNATDTTMKT